VREAVPPRVVLTVALADRTGIVCSKHKKIPFQIRRVS
jgi:hypothetical protein